MRGAFCVLVMLCILTSCSNKRYSHYSYLKKDKGQIHTSTKINTVTGVYKQPAGISQKSIGHAVSKGGDEVIFTTIGTPPNIIHKITVKAPSVNLTTPTNGGVKKKITGNSQLQIAEPELNRNAKRSIMTILGAILIAFIPLVGWVTGIIMLVKAIGFGLKAIKEIDNEPNKYYGMGMAMAGVFIGSLVVAFLIGLIMVGIAYILTEGSVGYTMFWLLY